MADETRQRLDGALALVERENLELCRQINPPSLDVLADAEHGRSEIQDRPNTRSHETIGHALGRLGRCGDDTDRHLLGPHYSLEVSQRFDRNRVHVLTDLSGIDIEERGNLETGLLETGIHRQSASEVSGSGDSDPALSSNAQLGSKYLAKRSSSVADSTHTGSRQIRQVFADLRRVDTRKLGKLVG